MGILLSIGGVTTTYSVRMFSLLLLLCLLVNPDDAAQQGYKCDEGDEDPAAKCKDVIAQLEYCASHVFNCEVKWANGNLLKKGCLDEFVPVSYSPVADYQGCKFDNSTVSCYCTGDLCNHDTRIPAQSTTSSAYTAGGVTLTLLVLALFSYIQ